MPPKAKPGAPSKKTEQKKKEKVIEVNDLLQMYSVLGTIIMYIKKIHLVKFKSITYKIDNSFIINLHQSVYNVLSEVWSIHKTD